MVADLVTRSLRQPLAILMVLAIVLLTLLALESASSKNAPSIIPLEKVKSTHTLTPVPACDNTNGTAPANNPHCRAASAG
jgi:hypothetical protein